MPDITLVTGLVYSTDCHRRFLLLLLLVLAGDDYTRIEKEDIFAGPAVEYLARQGVIAANRASKSGSQDAASGSPP